MTFTQKMQERAGVKMGRTTRKLDFDQEEDLDTLIAQTIADTCAEIEGRLNGYADKDPELPSEFKKDEENRMVGWDTYRTHTLEVLNEVKKV